MTLTVADALDLPVMQAGHPEVLSAEGLDRDIRWVHVSDVADLSNLLQGGELVLTTGAALRRSPVRYLRRLAEAGAVGVVVELVVSPAPLPDLATETATQLGLALVVLHEEVKFVEITEEVHRRIVSAQYAEAAFAWQVHEVFTGLTMQRAVPADIVKTTAELLSVPVVLEDLMHQAVAAASPSADLTAELLSGWERRSRMHEATGGDDPDQDSDWVVQAIGRGEEQWARLIALERGPRGERTPMVLERAAQALAMHRMAERGQVDLVRQAQAGLIEDVLQQRVRTEKTAVARATALGMHPAGQYHPAAAVVVAESDRMDPLAAQRRQTTMLDTLARTTRAHGHTGIFSALPDGEIGMVLSLRPGPRPAGTTLEELGRAMRRDIWHTVGHEALVLGLGAPRTTLVEAIDELLAAAHIGAVASSLPARDQVCFHASDIRLRGLVALLRDDVRAQRFAETELRRLILDDLATGSDGMGVLRGYLELSGNKTLLAKRLHLSRPSLYARLDRIEDILGVSLDDGESRASLHVALLILDARATPGRA